jgi:branched-chain amino acid transport system ATP-binding protein
MMMSCKDISKAFVGVKALSSVSLDIQEGETLGIIGPNGSGKTTLFNILSGFENADSGAVHLGGRDVTKLAPHRIASMGMARTFQNLRLFSGMTALENVIAGGHMRSPTGILGQLFKPPAVRRAEEEARQTALERLRDVGLDAHADSYAQALSYGQTKRLELARALNTHPRVLLLDEPTAGMNDVQAGEILDLVRRIKKKLGLTLVVIEHNVPVLKRFADRLVVLEAGQKLIEGDPDMVVRDKRVIEAYLGKGAA